MWRLGNFLKYRPLFGGKETDSDDEMAVPSFAKLPPSFSLEELKHMNQYAELKPAYDFISSGGMNTRDLTHASCFVSLHPEAPHPILYTTLKLSDERSLHVLFDTCSSLDLIDEDVAKQCNFPLRKSDKNYISCGRRSTNSVKHDSNRYAFIDTLHNDNSFCPNR